MLFQRNMFKVEILETYELASQTLIIFPAFNNVWRETVFLFQQRHGKSI